MRATVQMMETGETSGAGKGSASLLTTNPCANGVKLELTPQLWVDEDMDEYLKTLGNQTIAVSEREIFTSKRSHFVLAQRLGLIGG